MSVDVDDTERDKVSPIDNSAFRAIPDILFRAPEFPSNFVWWCPIDGCDFSIDFLNPNRVDVASSLSEESQHFLYSKMWDSENERLREIFEDLVEDHYFVHLTEYGVKLIGFNTNRVDVHGRPMLEERRISKHGELVPLDRVCVYKK